MHVLKYLCDMIGSSIEVNDDMYILQEVMNVHDSFNIHNHDIYNYIHKDSFFKVNYGLLFHFPLDVSFSATISLCE